MESIDVSSPETESATSLQDELIAAITGWQVDLHNVDGSTSLLRSGLFDSLALFNLVLWVEENTGGPVDPTTFDLVNEWDTVASVVEFVKRHRVSPAAGDAQALGGRRG